MTHPYSAATAPTRWRDPISSALAEVRAELLDDRSGAVAEYIPELAGVDPEPFGLSLVSLDGARYQAGDTDVAFTIQSISKPFVLALALGDLGADAVGARVGSEPSGEAFNAISLEPGTGRPANPMVNAGAIVISSLVEASGPTERFERILHCLGSFAGRHLDVDEAVFGSERTTGDRNRALAYLMRTAGSLEGDIDEILDVYFRQCSIRVTTVDLAVMAATLANGGRNPVTGDEVADRDTTAHVLAVMATCGMYDYAGQWLLRVGLPAKSGVSGGLVAASPGQFGIGLFSPRIDDVGNTARGVRASEVISDRFGLHLMRVPVRPARPVYLSTDGTERRSTRTRRWAEQEALAVAGHRVLVRGIGGDIEFAEAEMLVRSLADRSANRDVRWSVVDLNRVTRIHPAASAILQGVVHELIGRGIVVAVADPDHRLDPSLRVERFDSLDEALEWCEDALLEEIDPSLGSTASIAVDQHDMVLSLGHEDGGALVDSVEVRSLAVDDGVLDGTDELVVLVLAGRLGEFTASGDVTGAGRGGRVRKGSLGPGTAISRVRLLNRSGGGHRLAAETPSTVAVLDADGLASVERVRPGITGRLLRSLTGRVGGSGSEPRSEPGSDDPTPPVGAS